MPRNVDLPVNDRLRTTDIFAVVEDELFVQANFENQVWKYICEARVFCELQVHPWRDEMRDVRTGKAEIEYTPPNAIRLAAFEVSVADALRALREKLKLYKVPMNSQSKMKEALQAWLLKTQKPVMDMETMETEVKDLRTRGLIQRVSDLLNVEQTVSTRRPPACPRTRTHSRFRVA